MIENEQSPFVISKKGKAALDALIKENPSYEIYRENIIKTLSLRIIQKCRNFYKNIKLSKLFVLLPFYSSETEVERLLFEFNRQNMLHTTICFNTKGSNEGVITFNPENQLA